MQKLGVSKAHWLHISFQFQGMVVQIPVEEKNFPLQFLSCLPLNLFIIMQSNRFIINSSSLAFKKIELSNTVAGKLMNFLKRVSSVHCFKKMLLCHKRDWINYHIISFVTVETDCQAFFVLERNKDNILIRLFIAHLRTSEGITL